MRIIILTILSIVLFSSCKNNKSCEYCYEKLLASYDVTLKFELDENDDLRKTYLLNGARYGRSMKLVEKNNKAKDELMIKIFGIIESIERNNSNEIKNQIDSINVDIENYLQLLQSSLEIIRPSFPDFSEEKNKHLSFAQIKYTDRYMLKCNLLIFAIEITYFTVSINQWIQYI